MLTGSAHCPGKLGLRLEEIKTGSNTGRIHVANITADTQAASNKRLQTGLLLRSVAGSDVLGRVRFRNNRKLERIV